MKRFLALILVSVMLISGLSAVISAETSASDYDEAMGLLVAIEIMPAEINAEQSVTRADFAVYVARMFGVNDFAESTSRYYTDVPMDHYALTAINYLTERGIISGNGASNFYPDNGISVAEACKILIESVEYGYYAQSLGSYPTGYLRAARRFAILDEGLDATKQLNIGEAAQLIYNTLITDFAEIMNTGYYTVSSYTKPLLETFHKVYIAEGIVEATNGMAVYEDNLQDAEIISVAGKNLDNGIPMSTAVLLGEYVNAYYLSDDRGETGKLIYIYGDPEETESFCIKNDEYSRLSGNALYYYEDGANRERTLGLDRVYFVVYNGSPYSGSNNADAFKNLGGGSITFKDTDGNKAYDVVIIEDGKDFYVSYRNDNDEILNDITLSDKTIKLGDYETVEIVDDEGKALAFKDIPQKSILSVFDTADKRTLKLVVSHKTASGVIENLKTDSYGTKITLGKNVYEVEPLAITKSTAALKAGERITAYINSFGKVSYFEAVSPGSMQIGYLVALGVKEEAFGSRLMLRLCDVTGTVKEFICAEKLEIDTDKYTDPSLAEKAIPDYNATNGGVTPQIILYTTNAENEIRKIDTTNIGTEETPETSLVCNIKFNEQVVYGSGRLGLKAVLDPATTKQFNVPAHEKAAAAKDKNFSVGAVSLLESGWYDRVQTYRLRGDNVYEDILLFRDKGIGNFSNSDSIMLIEEVSKGIDDEGDEIISISGLLKGSAVTYTLDSDCAVIDHSDSIAYDVTDISEGDTVRVSESKGVVGSVEMIYDVSKGGLPDWCKTGMPNWYKVNEAQYYWLETQMSFGYVANKKDGIVEISYKNDSTIDEIYNQLDKVMVYDSSARTDKVYVGNIADIKDAKLYGAANCSRILFQTYQGKYMGVVVYK